MMTMTIIYNIIAVMSNYFTEVVMENLDIRKEAKGAGVPFWKIADYLKVSEPTFTRLMRRELPAEKKAEIRAIIKELSEVK